MKEHQKILKRIEKLNEAVEKARAYLANGEHKDWHGFRPLFGDSQDRPPHPDWVENVFIPKRLAAIDQCYRALETLELKEKERRTDRRRIRSK